MIPTDQQFESHTWCVGAAGVIIVPIVTNVIRQDLSFQVHVKWSIHHIANGHNLHIQSIHLKETYKQVSLYSKLMVS